MIQYAMLTTGTLRNMAEEMEPAATEYARIVAEIDRREQRDAILQAGARQGAESGRWGTVRPAADLEGT